ncbi:MAG: pilus assembly protein PilM [Candidatus Omnitrophica bacterium]|nr:pilus assembly protein PilM [Candidatus Omnitrophota bacterium]
MKINAALKRLINKISLNIKKTELFLNNLRPKVFTGLEINDRIIRLAQLKAASSGLEIVRCLSEEVNLKPEMKKEEKEASLLEAVKRLLANNKVKVSGLATSLPRHLAVARYITLPSTDEKEIKEMVRYEAERHIPFAIDKVEVSYQIIRKLADKSELLLTAVKKELLNEHLSFLKKAGLSPEVIDLTPFAAFNSFCYGRSEAGLIAVCLLNISGRAVDINIIQGDSLCFTRGVLIEGWEREGSAWRGCLADEVKRSFESYKRENNSNSEPGVIILSGGINIAGDGELEIFLSERLNLRVEKANAFKGLPFNISGAAGPRIPAFSMSVAIGLALRGAVKNRLEVNFLPAKMVEERTKKKREKFLKNLALFIGLSGFLITAFNFGQFYLKEAKLKELEKKIDELRPLATEAKIMREQVELISTYKKNKGLCLEILRELSLVEIIPKDVYLTGFVFEKDDAVIIRGLTVSHSVVSQMVSNLNNSKYFQNVERKYSRAKKLGDKTLVEFELDCPMFAKE